MANGAFNFKNNSGNIVSFISGSGSDIIISGGTLNLSNMTGLTLGNLTMEGTVETASFAPSYLLTSSFNTYSGNTNTVINTLATTSSVSTISSSINTRIDSITNIQATTGSNNFIGTQTITGSLYISQNLIVQGSSSLQDITGSNVYIGTNKINLNTDTPAIRFGGISVFDSGSNLGESGSLLWDSQDNHWIYQHPASSGAPYKSAILISGPRNSGSLGDELGLTSGKITKAVGNDHIEDSIMTETNGGIGISGSLSVTGSATFSSTIRSDAANGLGIGSISGYRRVQYDNSNTKFGFLTDGNGLADIEARKGFFSTNGASDSTTALLANASTNDSTTYSAIFGSLDAGYRMVVRADGNVGIGLVSPLSKFHVNTGTNQNFRVRPGTDVGATNGVAINSRSDDDGTLLQLTLRASDVIMLPSGNIGINTASPSEKLEVQDGYISTYHNANSNDAGYGIQFYTNGGGSKNSLASILLSQVGTDRSGNLLFQTSNAGAPSTKMTITSGGNVGIGTTAPSTQLNVGHQSHGIGISYLGSSSLPAIAGLFTDTSSGQQGYGSLLIKSRSDYAGYSINFYTAASNNTPVERLRINSTGNVGIGTTSPNGRLTIKAELSDTAPSLVFRNELGGPSSAISNFVSVAQTFTVFGTNVYVNSTGNFSRFDTDKQSCAIVLDEGLINFTTGPTGATPSSRMQITSNGNVGIGTSNPGQKLEVVGGEIKAGRVDSSNEGGQISFGRASDNATGWYIDNYGNSSSTQLRFVNVADSAVVMTLSGSTASIGTSYMAYPLNIEAMSGGGQLALTRSGAVAEFYMGGTTGGGTQLYVRSGGSGGVRLDAGSTGWVSASDIRLKDIEKPIENAVENLSTLQTVYYSWKNSDNKSLHLGLIAQEVESVFPEIVSESSIDEMKGVTYTELIPVLVKAIQEQQTQIEFLKTEIETLKQ